MTLQEVKFGEMYLYGKTPVQALYAEGTGLKALNRDTEETVYIPSMKLDKLKDPKKTAIEKTQSDYLHILNCDRPYCAKFRKFDIDNPAVMQFLIEQAMIDFNKSLKVGSVELYWGLLRREVQYGTIKINSGDSSYVMEDHHRTRYARAIQIKCPALLGWFTMKKLDCE